MNKKVGLIVVLAFLLFVGITLFVVKKLTESEVPEKVGNTPYTMAIVATHNSKESCWTTIAGQVYDLTDWVQNHPGGANEILSLCGKDGTSAFQSEHSKDHEPKETLNSYVIGVLQTNE